MPYFLIKDTKLVYPYKFCIAALIFCIIPYFIYKSLYNGFNLENFIYLITSIIVTLFFYTYLRLNDKSVKFYKDHIEFKNKIIKLNEIYAIYRSLHSYVGYIKIKRNDFSPALLKTIIINDFKIRCNEKQRLYIFVFFILLMIIYTSYLIFGEIFAIAIIIFIIFSRAIFTFLYNLLFRFKIRDILFDIIVIESKDDTILFVPDSKEDYLKVKEYFLNNLNIDLDKDVKKKFLYFKIFFKF